jgi:hypothetical protein
MDADLLMSLIITYAYVYRERNGAFSEGGRTGESPERLSMSQFGQGVLS